MNDVRSEWRGTKQHRGAADLSRWLVHLTRSDADLISILKSGCIEARSPYGAGKSRPAVQKAHHSVCLTEIPLDELHRMTSKRPWGLVFDKERLRAKFGAQPVWYLGDPSPQWDALKVAMEAARGDSTAAIWKLTPFIDRVGSLQSLRPNDWRWEREWRVPGDLYFELSDVAMIVVDEGGAPGFFDEVSVGLPWVSHDDLTVRWSGGFSEAWESEIEGMLGRFREQFVTVEEAALPWDREDQEYVEVVEILDTWDAMSEAFGGLSQELAEAIAGALIGESDMWCRVYDLEHVHE